MKQEKEKSKNPIVAVFGFSLPTWISFAISFLAIPAIAKVYLPEDVAKINLYNLYLNFFLMIVYFGLDQAYIRFYYECKEKRDKQKLLMYCMGFSLIVSVIISAGMFFMRDFVSIQIAGEKTAFVPFALSVSVVLNAFFRYLNVIDRMENNFFFYSVGTILMSLATKVLYVLAAFYNPNYKSALFLIVLGQIVVVLFLLIIHRREISIKSAFPFDKELFKELLKFGIPLLPVTILSWLNNSLSPIVLRNLLTFEALGVYTLAVSAANCISLVQAGINVFWTPFSYANYETGNDKIIIGHKYITMLMVLAGIGLTAFEDIIFIILGPKYAAAKAFFPFLLVAPICYTIAETTGIGTNIVKKTYLNIFSFGFSAAVNLLFSVVLIKHFGLVGAAAAAALGGITMLAVKTAIGQKFYDSIGNKKYMLFGISLMMLICICNYVFMGKTFIRLFSFAILFAIYAVFFRNEIKEGTAFAINFLKTEIKKTKISKKR